jgi:hypothetical protein
MEKYTFKLPQTSYLLLEFRHFIRFKQWKFLLMWKQVRTIIQQKSTMATKTRKDCVACLGAFPKYPVGLKRFFCMDQSNIIPCSNKKRIRLWNLCL